MVGVPLTPLVIGGLVLTVSIIGAPFGIPLLLVTAKPWWDAGRIAASVRPQPDLTPLARLHVGLCASVVLVGFAVASFVGWDDIDSWADAVAWAIAVSFVVSLQVGATRLTRPGSIEPAPVAGVR
jgi:hypothetical protein